MEGDDKETTKALDKEAVKEALKEWMDEKFITFGKWSLAAFAVAAFTAMAYFVLMVDGWKRP